MKSQELRLFAPVQYPLADVAAVLQRQGVCSAAVMNSWPDSVDHVRDPVYLVFPNQSVVSIGEHAGRMKRLIDRDSALVLCTPQLSPSDRKLLQGCGASGIISPRSWSPEHVAERILAELILAGYFTASYGAIIGATAGLRELCAQIQVLASLDETVLILGETGSGKELVATELHRQSRRPGQFLPINCAAISRDLLQSELFGHERGAFTNATHARRGLLVEAGNGTVFLDEIGELDYEAQAKLLRVIEERRVMPVGSNKWQNIHARMVMATNRQLDQDVAEGRFRQDLFMRLQGFTLSVPPLRDRMADLPLLARHFLEGYNREHSLTLRLPEGAIESLFHYNWPGNIRELRSAIRKSAAFGNQASGVISTIILQEAARPRELGFARYAVQFDPSIDTWQDVVQRAQRIYFRALLALTGGNKEAAAKRAGIGRTQFYEKLKNIDSADE